MTTHDHWRPDVQGLRAVAVMGVLVFHAGTQWLPGGFAGVDVFFVISGFLITQNLLREHEATGSVRLVRFFLGRLIRLAPAAVATVLATIAAVYLFLPPLDRIAARTNGLAALLGVENVQLARTGTDYLAEHSASPFQQFWSLGVEEQFYLGWALVIALLCAVPMLHRHMVSIVVALCTVGFGTMLVLGTINGPWTFFGVHTRAWEFLAGALVAVILVARRSGRLTWWSPSWSHHVQRVSAPLGFLLIGASFGLLDEHTTFPGVATLLPVAGAVLLVTPGSPLDPLRALLASRPFRWVGDRSYSLYLWHWPVFLLPTLAWDRPLAPAEILIASATTVLIGWASHAALERGVGQWARRSQWRPSALIGAVAVVAAATVPLTTLPALHSGSTAVAPDARTVLAGPLPVSTVPANVTPAVRQAAESVPGLYDDGCHGGPTATTPKGCTYGAQTANRGTVVLFGDSHAAQWATPVIAAAEQRGLRVVTMTKSACPAADVRIRSVELGRAYDECDTWRAAALQRIDVLAPDAVIVASAGAGYEALRYGSEPFADVWRGALERTLAAIDAPTVVLHDTPRWPITPNRCLSAAVDDVQACTRPTSELVRTDIVAAEQDAARANGTSTADPVPWICDEQCSPVLWNVLAYRDTDHITDELARTLTPRIESVLDEVLH